MAVSTHQPVRDYILLEVTDPPTTKGGLHVVNPDTTTLFATIMATGPGRPSEYSGVLLPLPCKVGDTVLFHGGAGTKVQIEGRQYRYLLPGDIIAVIEA